MTIYTNVFNSIYCEQSPKLEQIQSMPDLVLLEFGADWCNHCQIAAPTISDMLSTIEFTRLTHIRITDGKGKRLGRAFKIKLWPTLILLNNGVELYRVVRPSHLNDLNELVETLKTCV